MSIFKKGNFPLGTTKQEIEFLFEMVRKSPYVSGNVDYNRKAKNTDVFLDDRNIVNAYATSHSEINHSIVIFEGICNSTHLMVIGLAHFKETKCLDKLIETCQWIGNTAIDNEYNFSVACILQGIDQLKYDVNESLAIEAKSYKAGGILSVIAHEQGHICLSHTLRDDVSDEVSRNDERQADLFGCNVSATTPFASHIVLATLFEEIILTWMTGDNFILTTHPHSRERVYNTVNAHDVILRALGITLDNIDEFLPSLEKEEEEEAEGIKKSLTKNK